MAADDLERASIADVSGESTGDKPPVDIDELLFGAGRTEAIVADLGGEGLTEDDDQEVDDGPPMGVANPGIEPIGGLRAEWRPTGGESGGVSDTFDPTDLRASPDTSFGAGVTDAQFRIRDDVKYSDDADPPADGPHEVDIDTTGLEPEPTEIWLGPGLGDDAVPDEAGPGAVTEVFDTYAERVATDGPNFEDVD